MGSSALSDKRSVDPFASLRIFAFLREPYLRVRRIWSSGSHKDAKIRKDAEESALRGFYSFTSGS